MGFDNLKGAWEKMAKEYASKNSAYEDQLEAQSEFNEDALTELSNVRNEKLDQLMQISTIVQQAIPDDPSTPDIDETTPPIIEFSTAATPANMWSNPVMFSVIAERALLGLKPLQPLSGGSEFEGSKLVTMATQFYTVGEYTFPGPMDKWNNDKVVGFNLNQQYMSPSRFTGVGGESPNMTWTNNSLYGEGVFIGEYSNLYDTLTRYQDIDNPSNFVGVGDVPVGGGGDFGILTGDGVLTSGTSMYSGLSWNYGSATFLGDTYTFNNGLPAGNATEWTIPTGFSYQNSQYGVNAIPYAFGGPVDFMKGGSSYYTALNPEVPGFTLGFGISKLGDNPATEGEIETNYELGLPSGYAYGIGQVGNSRYIQSDGTIIPTGTHTRPLRDGASGTVTFDTTWSSENHWSFTSQIPEGTQGNTTNWTPPDGFTYSGNTLIPTTAEGDPEGGPFTGPPLAGGIHSLNPNPTTDIPFDNTITNGPGYSVDFMSGKSLHDASNVDEGFNISGFDIDYKPIWGGWAVETPEGDSKLLGLWNQTGYEGKVLTSMWTGYGVGDTGQTLTSVEFNTTWTPASSIPSLAADSDSNTWDIPEGFTYSGNTFIPATYDDSDPPVEVTPAIYGGSYSHLPNPTTDIPFDNTITNGPGYSVDFMSGNNSYYSEVNPVTDTNPFSGITGFTNDFTAGGYTFGDGDLGNSKFLTINQNGSTIAFSTGTHTNIPIHPYGNQSSFLTGATSTFSDVVGDWFTDDTLPLGGDETWTNPSTYYDSTYSINSANTYTGTGEAAPYHPSTEVDFTAGGWSFGSQIPTTTLSSNSWTPPEGFTYSGNTLIPTAAEGDPEGGPFTGPLTVGGIYSQHPNPTSYTGLGGSVLNKGIGGTGYLVDFMSGKSLDEFSLANSASMSGFTEYSLPYDKGTGDGNSELLALWDTEWKANGFLTSQWNVPHNDGTYSFETPVNFMGDTHATGFTKNISPLSASRFVNIDNENAKWDPVTTTYYDNIHPINIPPFSFADQSSTGLLVSSSLDTTQQINFTANWIANENLTLGENEGWGNIGDSEFLSREDGVVMGINTSNTHTILNQTDGTNYSFSNGSNLFTVANVNLRTGVKLDSSKGSSLEGQSSSQFNFLYNDNQTVNIENKWLGVVQDGSAIDGSMGDRFKLKADWWNSGDRVGKSNAKDSFKLATRFAGLDSNYGDGREPYIEFTTGNSDINSFPKTRLQQDTVRIAKFLTSPAGQRFIANQNKMGAWQQYKPVYDSSSTILNVSNKKEGDTFSLMLNFTRDTGIAGALVDLVTPTTYSEYLDMRGGEGPFAGVQQIGAAIQSLGGTLLAGDTYAEQDVGHKPLAFAPLDLVGQAVTAGAQALVPGLGNKAKDVAGVTKESGISAKTNMVRSMGTQTPLGNFGKGDIMTLYSLEYLEGAAGSATDLKTMAVSAIASALGGNAETMRSLDLDSSKEGMPFYFIDLRDNIKVYFRAYLDGINDSISPSWTPTNYIGRSEPVYTYTNTEREVGFSLKLFAQTKDELNMIYIKINRLASMCYPEYKEPENKTWTAADGSEQKVNVFNTGKTRMKPPLTKMRMGELFGSDKKEIAGFIKSLTFSFPDEGPWEIKKGQRVPKYVSVDITYQVIHSKVPSLDFAVMTDAKPTETFYGINKDIGTGPEGPTL